MDLPSDHYSKVVFPKKKGLRRTIRVYGPVDPIAQARRDRFNRENGQQPRKPHSGLQTSVRERLRP